MAEDGRPSERGHWPVKTKGWNVFRLWWELTKLVLQWRGGYKVSVLLSDLPDEVSDVIDRSTWRFVYVDWIGDDDRFAVLHAEAER